MLSRLAQAERLAALAKSLLAEHKKYARIQARYPADGTPRQKQKANNDLTYQAHHIVRIEAAIHAVAVDAGMADLREPEHYAERYFRPTGWHEYPWTPARPEALRA